MLSQKYLEDEMVDSFFASAELPSHFGFTAVQTLMPKLVSESHLRALMGKGQGPDYRKVGGKIVFERESFLKWLSSRVEK